MQSYAFFSNYQTFDNHIYDNFIYLTQIIFYLTQISQISQIFFNSSILQINIYKNLENPLLRKIHLSAY